MIIYKILLYKILWKWTAIVCLIINFILNCIDFKKNWGIKNGNNVQVQDNKYFIQYIINFHTNLNIYLAPHIVHH